MTLPPLILLVAAAVPPGCGVPRLLAPRPDHDLPAGFSSSYRRGLVLAGEVPPGPVDREELGLPPGPGWWVEPTGAPDDPPPVAGSDGTPVPLFGPVDPGGNPREAVDEVIAPLPLGPPGPPADIGGDAGMMPGPEI